MYLGGKEGCSLFEVATSGRFRQGCTCLQFVPLSWAVTTLSSRLPSQESLHHDVLQHSSRHHAVLQCSPLPESLRIRVTFAPIPPESFSFLDT
jgi:hypothetical protein